MLTPGQILQKRRMDLRKSIPQVSQETKIQEKYIKLLESEDYSQFDSNVFINGFMKIYSEHLGLDVEKMLALYRRSDKALKETPKKPTSKVKDNRKFDISKIVTPINVIILIAVLTIGTLIFFTVNRYNQLQQKPSIEISSPENNLITEESTVEIQGKITPTNRLTINEERVDVDSKGIFTKEYDISIGETIFTIEVEDPNTEVKNIKTLRIERVVKSVEIEDPEEKPEEKKEYTAYLEITGSATWLQLSIDGSQKIAQAVLPGKTDSFTVVESLELVTGKPTNTKLYINNQEIILNLNSSTGVASISCTIENNELNCPK